MVFYFFSYFEIRECYFTRYISVKKVDAANTSKVLSGTDFDLYTDSSCKTEARSVNDYNHEAAMEVMKSCQINVI